MPLVIVKGSPGRVEEIFIAAEPIGTLATVYITPGSREVREGDTQYQAQRAGVSIAGAVSGAVVRVVTAGFVSGVVCASGVVPGDRIAIACQSGGGFTSGTLASGMGKITPFNTITPAGTISRVSGSIYLTSGAMVSGGISGHIGIDGTALFHQALMSGVDGFRGEIPTLTGTAFNTGRVLGIALTSASPLSGQVIGAQILVMPGG